MAFCKKCGAQLGEGDLFCDSCGGKQENKSMQPVAQAPPPDVIVTQHAPPAAPPVYNQTVYNPPVYTPSTGGGQAMPKKPSLAMISIVSVLLVALIIVGSLYGVGTGKLSKANADIADLQTQLTTANGKVTSLTADLATANGKVTTLTSDLATANGKVTSITADLATANGKVTSITSDLAVANGKVTTLTASLATANGTATSLQTQLSAIQAKYPLKDFPDYATLNTWVKAHTQTYSTTADLWWAHALKVQSLAAESGYYISACVVPKASSTTGYTEVYNAALVGKTIYLFDPEDASSLWAYMDWGR